jgi:hypothetical protein
MDIRPAAVNCDDCGKHCPKGRRKEVKAAKSNGKQFWRQRCTTCGLHQDPYTGQYTLAGNKANVVWHSYMKADGLRRNNTKRTRGEIIIETDEFTKIENEQEIITKYHDNSDQ